MIELRKNKLTIQYNKQEGKRSIDNNFSEASR